MKSYVVFSVVLTLLASTGGAIAQPAGSEGDRLFAAADFAGAERAYRAVLREDERNGPAELGLARLAVYRNDLADAERRLDALDRDDPANARAKRLRQAVAERRADSPDYVASLAGGEVDVPFDRVDPLPELTVRVNGTSAHVLLDTGGEGLDLSAAFARRLGITTEAAGQGVFAGGLRGTVRTAHVDRLDLAGAAIRSLPVSVPGELPPGIDGVIGTRVLYQFLATIDYPHGRLVLRPKAASAAFEAAATQRRAAIVPMLLVPDHFLFARARIGSAPEALFNIDTGGGGIGVQATKAQLDAAAIVPDAAHARPFRGGGGEARTLPFAADVTLGDQTFAHVPGVYFPDGDQYGIFPFAVGGTLSHELFRRGTLTFDFSAMQLVFETASAPVNRPSTRLARCTSPQRSRQT